MNEIEYEEYVRQLAHSIWIEEGKPDGEQYIKTMFGLLKLKEIHWIKAESIAYIDSFI